MENGFGVDDLFQDETIPRLSSRRRVDARLDELRLSGCNSKIAWSKVGSIAVINSAGTGVETRHLACNPEDGRWVLSDAYPIANVSRYHENQRLVHVTWNSHGAELAVVDVLGRVSFYTVSLAVNHLTATRSQILDQDDDLSALVGFWWLPLEKQYALYRPAARQEDGKFRYQALSFKPLGPFHPIVGKVAAIGITRGGTVKMWYQDGHGRYQEVTAELEGFASLGDLFSHASISCSKDHAAVLAAYTLSKQLRVYRIVINWPQPNQPNQPHTVLPNPPTLVIKHLKIEDCACPADSSTHDVSRAQLTHLETLAPTPAPVDIHTAPGVLAVFANKKADGETFSVICRWSLKETPCTLHPSFDQMGVRRSSVSSPTISELELYRMDDVVMDKCIIGVSQVTSGTVIALAFSDGSLELRDRCNLNQLRDQSTNKNVVMNMMQAGFAFPPGEPCINLALSPNNAVAIRLGPDNDISLITMEYVNGPMEQNDNLEIACVALAHQHAYSCNNLINNDDLLLVAQKYRSPTFSNTFLSEAHRALNLKMDFATESPSERLFRNPLLQRCLSLQNSLDFRGERVNKRLSGKLAWATLHLRVASVAFALTFNNPQRQGQGGSAGAASGSSSGSTSSDIDLRPEALQTLLGLVRWLMDIMSLTISDLFELAKATKNHTSDLAYIRKKVISGNSPALFLALSSAPRALLRYNCRSLRGLETTAGKHLSSTLSTATDEETKATFRSLKVPIESCAVKISQFERIMTDIDGTIRAAYHNVPEAERAQAEKLLFVDNEIPPIFCLAVERLLNTTLPNLRNDLDIAKLFWHDVTWLGFHDDVASCEYRRKNRIDAIRKVVLPKDDGSGGAGGGKVKLRRCTRCCAVVEDIIPNKSPSNWFGSMQRMCFCGTLWMHIS
ncbi:mediator complex, subunit Med16 [Tuber brumale]|nr:mediator complex, subunit Med16 [Tuber brumale]